ncbi:Nn.00g065770.m01.CDS01 [Neocucurbitaria sp. VM-36]
MTLLVLIALAASPLLALAAQKRATPTKFSLYAYGEGIGGLQLFDANGYAYAGDLTQLNSSDAAPVIFTSETDDEWTGSPNMTDLDSSADPSWSNVTFFVPGSSSSNHRIGFLDAVNSTTDVVTSGFMFYGSTAMNRRNGALETLWSGLSVGNGVYELYWNDTSSGQVPITLRNIPPSYPSTQRRKA